MQFPFRRILTLLVVLFLHSSALLASDSPRWESLRQPYFHTIETDPGLPGRAVPVIAQDRDGFIWLTVSGALWRWDAYQCLPVSISTDSAEATPVIQTVKADTKGDLWAGTSRGLFRLSRHPLSLQPVNVPGLNSLSILHIETDNSGGRERLFIATKNQIFEWQPGTQHLQEYAITGGTVNRLHALHADGQGNLWAGTSQGLLRKSIASTDVPFLLHALPGNPRIASLFTDHAGQLWIGTAKAGVFILDDQQTLQSLSLPQEQGANPWIYSITETRPGIIWLGSFGRGILEYHTQLRSLRLIQHNRLLKNSLLDNNIWTLFRDQRGLIWIGSGRGLNLYDATETAFTYIPGAVGSGSLSDEKISSALATADDYLWLGTAAHGIDIVHPLKGKTGQIPAGVSSPPAGVPAGPVEALWQADANTILASSNWLITRISRDLKSVRPLKVAGRAADDFSSAFAWYRNRLWIGGPDGLWRLPDSEPAPATSIFSTQTDERRVASLLADDDILWAGTWNGLKQIQEDATEPVNTRIRNIEDPALSQQFISALARDTQQRIWAGSSSSGLFFNTRENIARSLPWRRLTVADGLPADGIASIQLDARGNLWVSTLQGIAFIDQHTLKVTSVLPGEGAAAAPYLRGSSTRNAAGEIIFGGISGLTIIRPDLWRASRFTPALVISSIETYPGRTIISESEGTAPLRLSISPQINRFTIEFAALDYVSASRLHYRFRLLGFDDQWHQAESRHRTATFTSLSPGTYEMQIQFSYDGIDWQSRTLSFQVNVLPAWYQQWWFRLLVAAAVLCGMAGALNWRTRLYRKRQRQLEQKVQERTAELQQANLQLEEKSRALEEASLTDPLTGLKNRRFLTQQIDTDIAQTQRLHRVQLAAPRFPFHNADLIFFLVDIDHFKRVNDQWGHAVGDAVLIEMRSRLMTVFRDSDYLVRWGGEEFLAVARNSTRETASALAERIRQVVFMREFVISEEHRLSLSCSIGYAVFPFIGENPEAFTWNETIAIADVALYHAKRIGRNTWVGFDTTGACLTKEQIDTLRSRPEAILQMESLRARHAHEARAAASAT